jgi:hypothetical protein
MSKFENMPTVGTPVLALEVLSEAGVTAAPVSAGAVTILSPPASPPSKRRGVGENFPRDGIG